MGDTMKKETKKEINNKLIIMKEYSRLVKFYNVLACPSHNIPRLKDGFGQTK